MKTKPLILGALLAITVVPSLQAQSLTLTFSDTFTSGQLDRTKWTYGGGPIINSETEAYVPDALSFSPSGLTIRTDHRPFTQAGITQPYTSGEITTEGRFFQTYGYFEACMKLPKGKGTWPAFWLIPENGSWPPEIDTLENLGEDPFTAYTSFHYNSTNIDVTQADVTGGDFSAGYHIYAVAWIPQSITYYIDGVQVFQVTGSNVPSTPMYMILNTAVGDGSGWGGAPNAYSVFPNTTEVQYVHAYQYNNVPTIGPDKAYFTGPMLIDTTTGAGVDATHPITPASAGDSMTLSTSLILSASKALPAETVHVQILDFFSQSIVQDTIVTTTRALA
ncbi:MAG TPA: glycoside hydrolase family 16 protein, partial [Candidatus Methylacidiphilales bacterium]